MGYNNRKNDNKKPKRYNQVDPVFEASPEKPVEGQTNLFLEIKAMKNLKASSISVQADPYQASLPASYNYPLQAKPNVKISPRYSGEVNLDGGNVQQYVNGLTSRLLKVCDYFHTRPYINYGYVPINPADATGTVYAGKNLIDERRNVWAETASVLEATTYTNLAINEYFIETDLPMGNATAIQIDGVSGYSDLADVLYATTTFYQLALQTIHCVIKTFNALRNKEGTMLRADFNRAVPLLNSFFTQINKAAMDGVVEGLCKAFPGEYFDMDFSQVVNHFICLPSRQSNDLFHPLLEMTVAFSAPTKFKIHILSDDRSEIISTIDLMSALTLTKRWFDDKDETSMNLFDVAADFADYLSAFETAKWARSSSFDSSSAVGRSNVVKFTFDGLITIVNQFKPKCADIREALDVLTRANIVRWVKGYQPTVTREFDMPNFDYLLLSDCIKSAFSCSPQAKFDNLTKRWKTWTLWNMYYGIPEYDTYSGGAFLTLSFKDLEATNDDDGTIGYVPRLFSTEDTSTYTLQGWLLNREGSQFEIRRADVPSSQYPAFQRLPVLESMAAYSIRVPKFVAPATAVEKSFIYRALLNIFGICVVDDDAGVDPDILAEYLIEISDITNEAITYARSNGIAVQGNVSTPSVLGFTLNKKV